MCDQVHGFNELLSEQFSELNECFKIHNNNRLYSTPKSFVSCCILSQYIVYIYTIILQNYLIQKSYRRKRIKNEMYRLNQAMLMCFDLDIM